MLFCVSDDVWQIGRTGRWYMTHIFKKAKKKRCKGSNRIFHQKVQIISDLHEEVQQRFFSSKANMFIQHFNIHQKIPPRIIQEFFKWKLNVHVKLFTTNQTARSEPTNGTSNLFSQNLHPSNKNFPVLNKNPRCKHKCEPDVSVP